MLLDLLANGRISYNGNLRGPSPQCPPPPQGNKALLRGYEAHHCLLDFLGGKRGIGGGIGPLDSNDYIMGIPKLAQPVTVTSEGLYQGNPSCPPQSYPPQE